MGDRDEIQNGEAKAGTGELFGLPVDNIRQDFYAMMTVANMISGAVRLADMDAKKEREGKQNRYEYQVNVNHAVGVFKDHPIRVLAEDNPIT